MISQDDTTGCGYGFARTHWDSMRHRPALHQSSNAFQGEHDMLLHSWDFWTCFIARAGKAEALAKTRPFLCPVSSHLLCALEGSVPGSAEHHHQYSTVFCQPNRPTVPVLAADCAGAKCSEGTNSFGVFPQLNHIYQKIVDIEVHSVRVSSTLTSLQVL